MKFIVTMKKNSPGESPAKTIDASNTNILIDNFGIKNDKPCLTMSSLDNDKIEIISFEDIDYVTTTKGKLILDHTKPQNVLVEEFKNAYEKEDIVPLKVIFNTLDGDTAKIWVTRRTTIDEAFKLSCIKVPVNNQPKFTEGIEVEDPVVYSGNTPIMTDMEIGVEFELKKFDVTLENFDGKGGIKILPKFTEYGATINSVGEAVAPEITAVAGDKMVAVPFYGDTQAEFCYPDVIVKGPITLVIKVVPIPPPM